jgi:hypothetical protein
MSEVSYESRSIHLSSQERKGWPRNEFVHVNVMKKMLGLLLWLSTFPVVSSEGEPGRPNFLFILGQCRAGLVQLLRGGKPGAEH